MYNKFKKYFKKQKIYCYVSYAQRYKIDDLSPVSINELGDMVNKHLGVGAVKSRYVVEIMHRVFQEAFNTGRPVPIGDNIIATPYVVSEDVRPNESFTKIMQVIPAHVEYHIDAKHGDTIGCYKQPEMKFYLRKTSKELDEKTVNKLYKLNHKETQLDESKQKKRAVYANRRKKNVNEERQENCEQVSPESNEEHS
jgi:hypothetical protein